MMKYCINILPLSLLLSLPPLSSILSYVHHLNICLCCTVITTRHFLSAYSPHIASPFTPQNTGSSQHPPRQKEFQGSVFLSSLHPVTSPNTVFARHVPYTKPWHPSTGNIVNHSTHFGTRLSTRDELVLWILRSCTRCKWQNIPFPFNKEMR